MRVLFCCNELARTGAPLVVAEVVAALSPDIVPTVYSPHDGPLREYFERLGVTVTGTLDVRGYDLVVANTVLTWEAVEAADRHGVPSVWVVYESDPAYFNVPQAVGEALRKPRAVVFPSRATASVYADYCRDRTRVVYFVVSPPVVRDRTEARVRLGLDGVVALAVGTVEERKNQRDLVQAARGLPLTAVLIGRVAHDDQVRHAPPNVRVDGPVADPSWHYAAADVFVSCSKTEALPRVHMEAAVNRLPILTTPCFGVREMVRDGVNGRFYRPGRVKELRELLILSLDPEFRAKLVSPLLNMPTFPKMVRQYEQILREAAGS